MNGARREKGNAQLRGLRRKAVVHVWVSDVNALATELAHAGCPIAVPPEDKRRGTREMIIRDPDGNEIIFAQTVADDLG